MTRNNTSLNRLTPVLAGFDAGHYTLPDEVLRLRAALDHVRNERPKAYMTAAAAETEYRQAAFDAAMAGEAVPDAFAVIDARRGEEEVVLRQSVVDDLIEELGYALSGEIQTRSESIIVNHLRPAFEEVVKSARDRARTFQPHGNDAAALLAAPEKARKAWLEMDGLAARYGAIRDARRRLVESTGQLRYDDGRFGELRNIDVVWPSFRTGGTPPWPTDDPRLRLVWLVTSTRVELWLPTAAEQDARWQEMYADKQLEHVNY